MSRELAAQQRADRIADEDAWIQAREADEAHLARQDQLRDREDEINCQPGPQASQEWMQLHYPLAGEKAA